MNRALKVLISCGALLLAGCGDSSRMSAELQNDLALASAGADLELASRPTSEALVVGAVERTNPPARAVTNSARAPRPRRSPTPQVRTGVRPETEVVREPELASDPAPVEEIPVEIAATTRPPAIESSSGEVGRGPLGTDGVSIIFTGGTVVIRGGGVGEDRCIPPGTGRGRTPAAINDRYPPRGRGTGRVATGGGNMGGNTGGTMGGRTGGQKIARRVPERPRDIGNRPTASPPRGSIPNGARGGNIERGTTSPVSVAVGVQ